MFKVPQSLTCHEPFTNFLNNFYFLKIVVKSQLMSTRMRQDQPQFDLMVLDFRPHVCARCVFYFVLF